MFYFGVKILKIDTFIYFYLLQTQLASNQNNLPNKQR